MKVFKIVLTILLVLFIVVTAAIYFWVKSFDINTYKDQIAQQISSAIGRDLKLGDIKLSFSLQKGVALIIQDFTLSDSPSFSSDNFVEVNSMSLIVDIQAMISKGELLVKKVEFASPTITLIRNRYNEWNVQKFKEPKGQTLSIDSGQQADVPQTSTKVTFEVKDPEEFKRRLDQLLVESIAIKNGTLIIRDQSVHPEAKTVVSKIDFKIDDFSLSKPFSFRLSSDLKKLQTEFNAGGMLSINIEDRQVFFKDVDIVLEFSKDLLKIILPYVPTAKGIISEFDLRGKLDVSINKLRAGPQGLHELSVDGRLVDTYFKWDRLKSPFEDIRLDFTASESNINVEKFSVSVGRGEIKGKGRVRDYLSKQNLKADVEINSIGIEDVIDQSNFPVNFAGTVDGQFDLAGEGFKGGRHLDSITGGGKMKVNGGKIIDLNILRFVLDKLSMLPSLVERIEANLPAKYKKKLQDKDTTINRLSVEANIREGKIYFTEALMDADSFIIRAEGDLDFSNNLYVKADFTIPRDLSQSMVVSAKELKMLLDDSGQIYIPLTSFRGKANRLRMFPDLEYLGKRIIVNTGREQLQNILNKVFDYDKDEEAPGGGREGEGGDGSVPKEKRPEQIIIENILDSIFN